ncbi:hypothetical protein B4099_3457 [Heyndrickxia coagulans]|uniref:Uncharacterized protein n=1 Tax=Heyndrickxia coagulans TaxID=1398 RepID=A0A150K8D2_HEYCO|nr:hypothetical protein B4099_3457 [Heyndrickxia coagulans]
MIIGCRVFPAVPDCGGCLILQAKLSMLPGRRLAPVPVLKKV